MNHQAELFVALQRLLPQHALSRLIARAAESKMPWLKNLLIKRAIAAFDINISEAASSDLDDYKNFNDFFTRALKDGARPMDQDPKGMHMLQRSMDGVDGGRMTREDMMAVR